MTFSRFVFRCLISLCVFVMMVIVIPRTAYAGRTCCIVGNDPATCNACDENIYWKNYGDNCGSDPSCRTCPSDRRIGNACGGGGSGIDICSLFSVTRAVTVQVGSTSGDLQILVKQGTYDRIVIRPLTSSIAIATPKVFGSMGLDDLGQNWTVEKKLFRVKGLAPGALTMTANQYRYPSSLTPICVKSFVVTVLPALTPSPTPTPTPVVVETSSINAAVYVDSPTSPASLSGFAASTNCTAAGASAYKDTGKITVTDTSSTKYLANLSAGLATLTVPKSSDQRYCVSLSSLPADYTVTCPSSGKYCSQDAPIPASAPLRFYVSKIGSAWYQTMGGDIGAMNVGGTALTTAIPGQCTEPGCLPYLSLPLGTNNLSIGALLTSDSSTVHFLTGSIAKTVSRHVKLPTPLVCRENYEYFYRLYSMGLTPSSDFTFPADATKPTNAPQNGAAYYHGGSLTIARPWDVSSGESKVIFVKGDLAINNTISVAKGGFLAFIVSGNISVDPSVGTSVRSSITNGQVQGVYISNQMIQILPQGLNQPDKKLVAEGTFAACNGIQIKRDFYGPDNNQYPSALFIYRPDFVLNAPAKMKVANQIWREVQPQ